MDSSLRICFLCLCARLTILLQGEKCLITGGLGFLGKNLVERLLSRGAYVRVMDLRPPQEDIKQKFEALAAEHGAEVEFQAADLTSLADCEKAVDGMDIIFHCASPRYRHITIEIFSS